MPLLFTRIKLARIRRYFCPLSNYRDPHRHHLWSLIALINEMSVWSLKPNLSLLRFEGPYFKLSQETKTIPSLCCAALHSLFCQPAYFMHFGNICWYLLTKVQSLSNRQSLHCELLVGRSAVCLPATYSLSIRLQQRRRCRCFVLQNCRSRFYFASSILYFFFRWLVRSPSIRQCSRTAISALQCIYSTIHSSTFSPPS